MSGGGYQRLAHREWQATRGQLTAPWPSGLIAIDVRYLLDMEEHYGEAMPSIRTLSDLWGVSRNKAHRTLKAARKQRDTSGTKVGQQWDTSGTPDPVETSTIDAEWDASGTAVGHERDSSGTADEPSISTRARKEERTKNKEQRTNNIWPAALGRAGVVDLEQLAQMTRQQAASIKGVGTATLQSLDKRLEAAGLAWTRPTLELVSQTPQQPNPYRVWLDTYRQVMGRDYTTTSVGRDAKTAKELSAAMRDAYASGIQRYLEDHRDGRPCWPHERPADLGKLKVGGAWRKYVEDAPRQRAVGEHPAARRDTSGDCWWDVD